MTAAHTAMRTFEMLCLRNRGGIRTVDVIEPSGELVNIPLFQFIAESPSHHWKNPKSELKVMRKIHLAVIATRAMTNGEQAQRSALAG
jgi:hypothetical protein